VPIMIGTHLSMGYSFTMSKAGKTNRSFSYEDDIMAEFDTWADDTKLQKGAMAQLGIWIVMRLLPGDREALQSAMRTGRRKSIRLVQGPESRGG